jgi:hypothetical protein
LHFALKNECLFGGIRMVSQSPPTLDLIPDPISICTRLKQLKAELRLKRRPLRLA